MNLTEILLELGFNPPVAKTLVYFIRHPEMEVTSREIERAVDVRQPEASIAL